MAALPPLELFISTLFQSLSLPNEEIEQIEYLARLVEEEALEDEDKLEAIKGLLEGEGAEESVLESSAQSILDEFHRISSLPPEKKEEEVVKRESTKSTSTTTQQPPDEATLAAQRKAYLLRQYALVEDSNSNFASPFADGSSSGGPAPGPGDPGYKGGKDKTEVSPEQLEAEMKRMAMKKKQKAKLKEDDMLRPNLNKQAVAYAQQQQREQMANASASKRQKDKEDLAKQKANEVKKLEEKRKKAAKGERRA